MSQHNIHKSDVRPQARKAYEADDENPIVKKQAPLTNTSLNSTPLDMPPPLFSMPINASGTTQLTSNASQSANVFPSFSIPPALFPMPINASGATQLTSDASQSATSFYQFSMPSTSSLGPVFAHSTNASGGQIPTRDQSVAQVTMSPCSKMSLAEKKDCVRMFLGTLSTTENNAEFVTQQYKNL
jgi:hypothetical protein